MIENYISTSLFFHWAQISLNWYFRKTSFIFWLSFLLYLLMLIYFSGKEDRSIIHLLEIVFILLLPHVEISHHLDGEHDDITLSKLPCTIYHDPGAYHLSFWGVIVIRSHLLDTKQFFLVLLHKSYNRFWWIQKVFGVVTLIFWITKE